MGDSSSHAGIRHEVAPVTRFHDQFISDPQHTDAAAPAQVTREHDPESIMEMPASSRSSSEATCRTTDGHESRAPLVPTITPFFHFDLASAVRAAEHNLFRPVTSESSTHKSEDDLKVAISGHDIITTEIAQR